MKLTIIDGPYGLNKYSGDEIRTLASSELYRCVFARASTSDHVIVFGTFNSLAWINENFLRKIAALELRRDVVWHKPDWTAGGNSTFAPRHELFLHLARPGAQFNLDAIRVPYGERATKGVAMKGGRNVGWQPNPLGARCPDVIVAIGDRLTNKVAGRTQVNKHPCVKPKSLLRTLVLACSNAGDVVEEPFVGSDNLKEVVQDLGRVYQGWSNALDYARETQAL